LTRSSCNSGC